MTRVTRISVLLLLLALAAQAAPGGKLPYRFGMTKTDVRGETACSPYLEVPSTGGLECPNFVLDRKRNISFVFDAAGLAKIQLWFAEAASREDAMRATEELLAYLTKARDYGVVQFSLEGSKLGKPIALAYLDPEVAKRALFAALDGVGGPQKVQLRPQRSPVDAVVFASIMRHPTHGYYVFLYYTRPEK